MPDFHTFMMRHGEYGVQGIIEQIERCQGMRSNVTQPLEQRWVAAMLSSEKTSPRLFAA